VNYQDDTWGGIETLFYIGIIDTKIFDMNFLYGLDWAGFIRSVRGDERNFIINFDRNNSFSIPGFFSVGLGTKFNIANRFYIAPSVKYNFYKGFCLDIGIGKLF